MKKTSILGLTALATSTIALSLNVSADHTTITESSTAVQASSSSKSRSSVIPNSKENKGLISLKAMKFHQVGKEIPTGTYQLRSSDNSYTTGQINKPNGEIVTFQINSSNGNNTKELVLEKGDQITTDTDLYLSLMETSLSTAETTSETSISAASEPESSSIPSSTTSESSSFSSSSNTDSTTSTTITETTTSSSATFSEETLKKSTLKSLAAHSHLPIHSGSKLTKDELVNKYFSYDGNISNLIVTITSKYVYATSKSNVYHYDLDALIGVSKSGLIAMTKEYASANGYRQSEGNSDDHVEDINLSLPGEYTIEVTDSNNGTTATTVLSIGEKTNVLGMESPSSYSSNSTTITTEAPSATNTNANAAPSTVKSGTGKTLPKTGERSNKFLLFLGMMIATTSIFIGFKTFERYKKDSKIDQ